MALTLVTATSTPDYTQTFSALGCENAAMPRDPILENKSTSVPPQEFEMNIKIMPTLGAICQLTKQNIPGSRSTYTIRKPFPPLLQQKKNRQRK